MMPLELTMSWAEDTFIGIQIWQFIGIGVMAILIVVLRFLSMWLLRFFIRRRTRPERHEFWDRELARIGRPLLLMIGAVVVAIGFPVLAFDDNIEKVVAIFSSFLSTFAGVMVGFRLVDSATDYWAVVAEETESKLDDQLVPLARTAGKIFVGAIGAIFILQNLDINITSLIAGLGIGGVAVALAAQDTLKNLARRRNDSCGPTVSGRRLGDHGRHRGNGREDRLPLDADSHLCRLADFGAQRADERHGGEQHGSAHLAALLDHGRASAITPIRIGFKRLSRACGRLCARTRTCATTTTSSSSHSFGDSALNILVYTFIGASTWNEELRTRHVFNLDIMRLADELQVDFAFPRRQCIWQVG